MTYSTRKMRNYQASRRGSTSWKTLYERSLILLAWEAGEISTGCASKALGLDIVDARGMKNESIKNGDLLAAEFIREKQTESP